MDECKSCGKDMDRQGTHWVGCHTHHPECAAFRAGREAGMREAVGSLLAKWDRGDIVCIAHCEEAILSAIGGDK